MRSVSHKRGKRGVRDMCSVQHGYVIVRIRREERCGSSPHPNRVGNKTATTKNVRGRTKRNPRVGVDGIKGAVGGNRPTPRAECGAAAYAVNVPSGSTRTEFVETNHHVRPNATSHKQ